MKGMKFSMKTIGKTKVVLSLMICCSMLMLAVPSYVSADDSPIRVRIGTEYVECDVPPLLVSDRVMVPFRAIFEAFGAEVEWDGATGTVTGTLGDRTVILQLDSTAAQVNSELTELDVPPMLIDNRTLVPVRFVSESLGAKVEWIADSRLVQITPAQKISVELDGKQLELIYEDDFAAKKNNFKLEGMGEYEVKDGALYLSDPVVAKSGTTLWVDEDFSGDLYVSYNCKTVNLDGAKNLNLFFLATTLDGDDVLSEEHSGVYADYHTTVNSYILTFTGDSSAALDGWSRFRKDPGFVIMSEDASAKTLLDVDYFIEIIKLGENIKVLINGKLIHDVTDSESYNNGKIGFRTWQSETIFDDFKVYRIK